MTEVVFLVEDDPEGEEGEGGPPPAEDPQVGEEGNEGHPRQPRLVSGREREGREQPGDASREDRRECRPLAGPTGPRVLIVVHVLHGDSIPTPAPSGEKALIRHTSR